MQDGALLMEFIWKVAEMGGPPALSLVAFWMLFQFSSEVLPREQRNKWTKGKYKRGIYDFLYLKLRALSFNAILTHLFFLLKSFSVTLHFSRLPLSYQLQVIYWEGRIFKPCVALSRQTACLYFIKGPFLACGNSVLPG